MASSSPPSPLSRSCICISRSHASASHTLCTEVRRLKYLLDILKSFLTCFLRHYKDGSLTFTARRWLIAPSLNLTSELSLYVFVFDHRTHTYLPFSLPFCICISTRHTSSIERKTDLGREHWPTQPQCADRSPKNLAFCLLDNLNYFLTSFLRLCNSRLQMANQPNPPNITLLGPSYFEPTPPRLSLDYHLLVSYIRYRKNLATVCIS